MYTVTKKKTNKDSTVELRGSVDADIIKKHEDQVFQDIRSTYEAPGFRKGNVPDNVVREQVPASHILEQAAHRVLEEIYPHIVKEEKLEVLSAPSFSVTKLAPGNPLEFTLQVGIVPEVKLPAYKKIAKEVYSSSEASASVSDQEVEDAVNQIRTMRASQTQQEDGKPELPELTDDFVQSLGNFKTVEDFKRELRKNLAAEKKNVERRKLRERLAHQLVEKADCPLSPLTIQSELGLAKQRFEQDLGKQNLKKDEYFEKVGQTEEDFWKKQEEYITEHFKAKLILKKIAEEESLSADPEGVKAEVSRLKQNFPDQNDASILDYVTEALTNDAVLRFLEREGGFETEEKPSKESSVDKSS